MKNFFCPIGFIIALTLLCYSCKNKLTPLEESYRNLKNSEIIFPQDLQLTWEGKDTTLNNYLNTDYKLIIYRDSISCNQCYLETFPQWNKLKCELDSCYGPCLSFIYILSPLQKDEADLRFSLQVLDFKHPIYLDKNKSFQRYNPQVPHERSLQIFLVNKKNKVILIGDPLTNKKIRLLLEKKIQTNSIINNLFNF